MFIAQHAVKKRIGIFLTVLGTVLLLCAFVLGYIIKDERSISFQLNKIDKELVKNNATFSSLINDTTLINHLILGQESLNEVDKIKKNNFNFFLYKLNNLGNDEYLRYWSSNIILPDSTLKSKDSINGFYHLDNGYYYVQKKAIPYNPNIYAYAFTLIKYDFKIKSDFIQNEFSINSNLHNYADISSAPTEFAILAPDNKEVLYVNKLSDSQIKGIDNTVIILKVVGIVFLFFGIFSIILGSLKTSEAWELFFLGLFFLFLRVIFQLLDPYIQYSQLNFSKYEFVYFDIKISNLGWLLMDVSFMFLLLLATYNVINARIERKREDTAIFKFNSDVLKVLIPFIFVSNTFLAIELIKDLILHSRVSFDITNFESLSFETIIGFLLMTLIVFNYYLLSRILFKVLFNLLGIHLNEMLFYSAIAVLLWLAIFSKSDYFLFYCSGSVFIFTYIVFVCIEKKSDYKFKFNISRRVFWVSFFSVFCALCLVYFINKNEIILRKNLATSLLVQPDKTDQKAINEAIDSLSGFISLKKDRERFINIEKKLDQLSPEYKHELIVFDSSHHAVFNENNISYETLIALKEYYIRAKNVDHAIILNSSDSAISYLNFKKIEDSSHKYMYHLFIVSSSNKNPIYLLSQELFFKFNVKDDFNAALYQYAVYKNNTLVSSNSSFPFALSLDPSKYPTSLFQEQSIEGFSLLWYRPNYNDLLVIVRKTNVNIQLLTIFSYFFCIFFLLIIVIEGLPFIYSLFQKDRKTVIPLFEQTIRRQVYSTFVIISIIIFVVISIATVQFYISAFEEYNNERITNVANSVKQSLQNLDFQTSKINGSYTAHDSILLNEKVGELARIHRLDMNIYDPTGSLIASSQMGFYNQGFTSKQIDDIAFYNLMRLRKVDFSQEEQLSNLVFSNIYSPILNSDDKLMGYMSVPYFSMNRELGQKLVEVIITLLNLYTFIFLVTSIISLFITERITRSLSIISNKIQNIDFLKNNEPIEWHRKDEIGKLVDEYNKMLDKVKESMQELAIAQREMAWREMAKQVAHEIKNPLTPMKLNLQYLQRAIQNNQANITSLTHQVSESMVEQIDHLSRIASEFMEFASITKSKKEVINLHESLNQLKNVYSIQPNIHFEWNPINDDVFVMGDRTHINRLFTNLIINAIDASEDDDTYINISESLENEPYIKIIVADKGKGINEETAQKLFTPNFTTKNSGTGLGLAMCKGIVEQMHGKIWYDEKTLHETRICIKLPIIK